MNQLDNADRRHHRAWAPHGRLARAVRSSLGVAMLCTPMVAMASMPGIAADAAGSDAVSPAATSAAGATPAVAIDLSYINKRSREYARFRSWVDDAAIGRPGDAFAASDPALMARLDDAPKYCDLAVRMVEQQVGEAESAIAGGDRPEVSGDSYLEVGPLIADLALALDSCGLVVTAEQRRRWSRYAEQAVWNVWHHEQAAWGGKPHAWSGWAADNPGNNYYYSFLEATMYWALASGAPSWRKVLADEKLPPLKAYFAQLAGGGSREGTGYGASHMHLFALYRLWRDATGEDLALATPHARDSIFYWAHATVPTMDRFAPIGDQARNSTPDLYDYHRRLMLEARSLVRDPEAQAVASWWLDNISIERMTAGFNSRYDLLPASEDGTPPGPLVHHATGTGHLFARTDWSRDAMWVSFVAGPYEESHAHQDQGAFTLFAGDWLAVTQNIWSHSGINQSPQVHNVVRFERANPQQRQCRESATEVVVPQCAPTYSTLVVEPGAGGAFTATADLTPAYSANPAVRSWQRRLEFRERRLTVRDSFQLGSGTRAIFQVNVPSKPQVKDREVIAGRLRLRVLEPAHASISVHDWRGENAEEFDQGWRIDIAGGTTGYVVELAEK